MAVADKQERAPAVQAILSPRFEWRSLVMSKHGPGSSTVRLVLVSLSMHMSLKGDSCFPTTQQIMDDTAFARSTVLGAIKSAAEDGWISKRHDYVNGRLARVFYYPTVPTETLEIWRSFSRTPPPPEHSPPESRGPANESTGPAERPKYVTKYVKKESTYAREGDPSAANSADPPMGPASDQVLRAQAMDDFAYTFWPGVPAVKRTARGAARSEFVSARVAGHALTEIMAGLPRYAAKIAATAPADLRFIPSPAKWLREERWADEDPEAVTSTHAGSQARSEPQTNSVTHGRVETETGAESESVADDLDRLAEEHNPERYADLEKLASVADWLRGGRSASAAQKRMILGIAQRVRKYCKPTVSYNCPPRKPTASQQASLDACDRVVRWAQGKGKAAPKRAAEETAGQPEVAADIESLAKGMELIE